MPLNHWFIFAYIAIKAEQHSFIWVTNKLNFKKYTEQTLRKTNKPDVFLFDCEFVGVIVFMVSFHGKLFMPFYQLQQTKFLEGPTYELLIKKLNK